MDNEAKHPKVGDHVLWIDEHGKEHNALVLIVWDKGGMAPEYPVENPTINLVVVNPDPSRDDSYGRQIERHTSVPSARRTTVRGRCWDWPAA